MAIVIIDCQNDFITGTMAVRGAKEAIKNINKLLSKNKDINIIFTKDWHPQNHCSFKENGGQWPTHCVQYTNGANIDMSLFENINTSYTVVLKGQNPLIEEYGAFSNDFPFSGEEELIICGIAGDFCVKESIKNLLHFPIKIKIFLKGIASIDDGTTINNFIKENNLEVYDIE